jgi:hypothetical protein
MQTTIFTVVAIFMALTNFVTAIDLEPGPLIADPIPKNYTVDRDFQLDFNVRNIILSPD